VVERLRALHGEVFEEEPPARIRTVLAVARAKVNEK
jgi:hypothetical protein